MNQEDFLNLVEKAIKNRTALWSDKFHICFFYDEIQCFPRNHTDIKHPIFFKCTNYTCEHGFSSREWNNLGNRLAKFFKENPKCLERLIH